MMERTERMEELSSSEFLAMARKNLLQSAGSIERIDSVLSGLLTRAASIDLDLHKFENVADSVRVRVRINSEGNDFECLRAKKVVDRVRNIDTEILESEVEANGYGCFEDGYGNFYARIPDPGILRDLMACVVERWRKEGPKAWFVRHMDSQGQMTRMAFTNRRLNLAKFPGESTRRGLETLFERVCLKCGYQLFVDIDKDGTVHRWHDEDRTVEFSPDEVSDEECIIWGVQHGIHFHREMETILGPAISAARKAHGGRE